MKLIVRADAGIATGTGHLMRCIALAQAWQEHGGQAVFITVCESGSLRQRLKDEGFKVIEMEQPYPNPSDWEITAQELRRNPDAWVVLDGYHFDPEYQLLIKEMGHRLLVIDDMAHLVHYYADIVLNQNINAEELKYSCEPNTKLLLGTNYVLLRQEFITWKGWQRHIPEVAQNVLVTMGGSDPDNVTLKVIQALEKVEANNLHVIVVVGGSNPHVNILKKVLANTKITVCLEQNTDRMPELMTWADIAVSAGGSTCWELAFMGVPSIICVMAPNQEKNAHKLREQGVSIIIRNGLQIKLKILSSLITQLMKDLDARMAMVKKGSSLVDGNGAVRITNYMIKGVVNIEHST